jgi:copper homeostasis protein
VKEIAAAVSIPVRVMLRENEGFEIADREELRKLCAIARELAALEIDGVVLGFLRGRSLNLASAQQILSCAPRVKATFHRAFEERVSDLKLLAESAAPQLTIVAGGGIDGAKIRPLRESAAIREFHVGRAARRDGNIHQPVDAPLVQELAALVSRLIYSQRRAIIGSTRVARRAGM